MAVRTIMTVKASNKPLTLKTNITLVNGLNTIQTSTILIHCLMDFLSHSWYATKARLTDIKEGKGRLTEVNDGVDNHVLSPLEKIRALKMRITSLLAKKREQSLWTEKRNAFVVENATAFHKSLDIKHAIWINTIQKDLDIDITRIQDSTAKKSVELRHALERKEALILKISQMQNENAISNEKVVNLDYEVENERQEAATEIEELQRTYKFENEKSNSRLILADFRRKNEIDLHLRTQDATRQKIAELKTKIASQKAEIEKKECGKNAKDTEDNEVDETTSNSVFKDVRVLFILL